MAAVVAHTERAHATFSPSSASKWMKCGQSIEQAKRRKNSATSFTQEGTAAHELAELCLVEHEDAETFLDLYIDLRKTGEDRFSEEGEEDGFYVWQVSGEMVDGVQLYLDTVRDILRKHPDAEIDVEQRIDLRHLGADIWGTGDVVIYIPSTRKLYVIDLKYGRGYAVTARQNPQLLVYGTGAAARLHNRGVDEIELIIVQPRAAHSEGPVRRYLTDWTELHTFTEEILEGIRNQGGPAFAGDHCAFCPGTRDCEAFRTWVGSGVSLDLNVATLEDIVLPKISSLTADEISQIYQNADRVDRWAKAIKEMALEAAHAGVIPPGLKMVEGRGYRKWVDEDAAKRKLLKSGVPIEDITKTKFVSPNAVEKAVGKKRATELIGELVYKAPGRMTLAPISDSRPDMTPGQGYTVTDEDENTEEPFK